MTVFFKKAERKNAKLRLALAGPTGSGKTMGALLIAKGIGGKVAVVDTENSSAVVCRCNALRYCEYPTTLFT